MPDLLQINVLGDLVIRQGELPLGHFRTRKAPALLAYLAYTGRSHRREALADLLWETSSTELALSNLRSVLTHLRARLADYLVTTRQTVGLSPNRAYRLDALDLHAQLTALVGSSAPPIGTPRQAAQLDRALKDYHDDSMACLHLPDAPRYNEWLMVEQERLRRLVFEGYRRLVGFNLARAEYRAGIAAAARWLALDPLDEAAHAQMMRLLAADGQRSAALAQYEVCRRVLREELGVEPDAATALLDRQIRSGELDLRALGVAQEDYASGPPLAVPTVLLRNPLDPRHNLPAPATKLIGRDGSIAQLQALLRREDVRLVTLVGPGGVGKTRLAIEAAAELAADFADGVRFVPLDSATSAGEVIDAIVRALAIQRADGQTPIELLIDAMEHRAMLLVLDNLEQVRDASRSISTLMAAIPGLKLLLTSRVVLHLYGEYTYEVPLLSVPDPRQASAGIATLAEYASFQLFVARAQAARADFQLTPAASAAIAAICARLDGLPLAIELAAARSALLPPDALLNNLDQVGIDLLSSGARDRPARQQTLRDSLDWSYRLLTDDERFIFVSLAGLSEVFSLHAAMSIDLPRGKMLGGWAAKGAVPPPSVLDTMSSLVDWSLVQRVPEREALPQFKLLSLVRAYAREKLFERETRA